METDLPVTGCGSVPFDLEVNVDSGRPVARRFGPADDLARLPEYADDPIWQSSSRTPTRTCRPAWAWPPVVESV